MSLILLIEDDNTEATKRETFKLDGRRFRDTLSPEDQVILDELLRLAQAACDEEREQAKNQARIDEAQKHIRSVQHAVTLHEGTLLDCATSDDLWLMLQNVNKNLEEVRVNG